MPSTRALLIDGLSTIQESGADMRFVARILELDPAICQGWANLGSRWARGRIAELIWGLSWEQVDDLHRALVGAELMDPTPAQRHTVATDNLHARLRRLPLRVEPRLHQEHITLYSGVYCFIGRKPCLPDAVQVSLGMIWRADDNEAMLFIERQDWHGSYGAMHRSRTISGRAFVEQPSHTLYLLDDAGQPRRYAVLDAWQWNVRLGSDLLLEGYRVCETACGSFEKAPVLAMALPLDDDPPQEVFARLLETGVGRLGGSLSPNVFYQPEFEQQTNSRELVKLLDLAGLCH